MTSSSTASSNQAARLDQITGGAFSASTSGERSSRVRTWLLSNPTHELLSEVFKDLSVKDKGAAKLVRERLDEIKRAKGQEVLAAEWAAKASELITQPRLNIADAMAWQRDAAKAGAPLSREPLAALRQNLADRVRAIEDLQHRVQVHREAAVLLAQRIEVLSTKPLGDARAAGETLTVDVSAWQSHAGELAGDSNWESLDSRFAPLLDASKSQLLVVWDAFSAALSQAILASTDPTAPLPAVPVWADELRAERGVPVQPPVQSKPKVDPEVRAKAVAEVRAVLKVLEDEVSQGHGKASTGAANALRHALKDFGKLIDDKLENQAHAALAAASELEGWQRWRADQLREELVTKAESLLNRPKGQEMGGRKLQETLRALRDQWKQTDQGGVPNHALWKRFDEACTEAYKNVQVWLEKVKAEAAEHKSMRMQLIEEVNAWAAENQSPKDGDWKSFSRSIHQFSDRWRDAGHVGEKVFAELQSLWKVAIGNASAPLDAKQEQSIASRQALIEEAKKLGCAPVLRVDAVKALQQRWQVLAHEVPLERRAEQKLWDAFRKPIDEAFNRKAEDRQKAEAALNEHDRGVLEASKALEAANATGNALAIREALNKLESVLHGQAQANVQANPQANVQQGQPDQPAEQSVAAEPVASDGAETEIKAKPAKPVIAVRGDDRPGMKKETATQPTRPGRPAARGHRDERPSSRQGESRSGDQRGFQSHAPRLGDAAFRAQREAFDNAQSALKKLAAQAHGEALVHLLSAWEKRDAQLVPAASELGSKVSTSVRSSWIQSISDQPKNQASATSGAEALLRMEMAAEVPTPAEHLDSRRQLQLKLLTRRNDPSPAQTWGQDFALLLSGEFDAIAARRVQNALKVLLRK